MSKRNHLKHLGFATTSAIATLQTKELPMTQSNEPGIEQMNEAIRQFAGLEPYEDSRYGKLYNSPVDGKTCFSLQYHTSWDWLMPVVEKIKRMCNVQDMPREFMSRWAPIKNELLNIRIDHVHYCVYRFITWYKQQNTTNEQ